MARLRQASGAIAPVLLAGALGFLVPALAANDALSYWIAAAICFTGALGFAVAWFLIK
jgi:hypothetical protein